MPNTDYRGVFSSTNNQVFIPTPQSDIESASTPCLNSNSENHRSVQSSFVEEGAKVGAKARQYSNPLDEEIDFTAPPGRRHYIAEVLKNQGISIALCAKRLGVTQEEVLRQLNPFSNLTLNQLFSWSEVLDVPLPELLPFDASTSDPIRNRALLLRIMKTARQIQSLSAHTSVQYAAETLVVQLLELVPEIRNKLRIYPVIKSGHRGLVVNSKSPYVVFIGHSLKHIRILAAWLSFVIEILWIP